MIKFFQKKQNGFTLLFASLIVSLLLAVGLAILNITLQQLLLSSAGRESQYAFYNADTGIECALFYDKNDVGGIFATSSLSTNTYTADEIKCAGLAINNYNVSYPDSTSATTIFHITIDPNNKLCPSQPGDTFYVEVQKYTVDSIDENGNTVHNIATTIKSRGYNTCDLSNPRRVERGLLVNY